MTSTLRVGEDSLAAIADLARMSVDYARCPVPIRVFGGDRDLVIRNGLHGRLLAALAPDAAFTDLPGLGHMVHHFATDRIVEAIDELLS